MSCAFSMLWYLASWCLAVSSLILIKGRTVLINRLLVVSTVLFYLAKKRSWEVRATIRRSAKKVATALTPRRTTFPKGVMDERIKQKGNRGMSRIEEVPPTPRLTNHDIEKAHAKADAIEMREPSKWAKWGRPRSER